MKRRLNNAGLLNGDRGAGRGTRADRRNRMTQMITNNPHGPAIATPMIMKITKRSSPKPRNTTSDKVVM